MKKMKREDEAMILSIRVVHNADFRLSLLLRTISPSSSYLVGIALKMAQTRNESSVGTRNPVIVVIKPIRKVIGKKHVRAASKPQLAPDRMAAFYSLSALENPIMRIASIKPGSHIPIERPDSHLKLGLGPAFLGWTVRNATRIVVTWALIGIHA